MKNAAYHIGCPSCGGTLAFSEGQRAPTCPSCGVRSLVEIKEHTPKYFIEPTLSLKSAKLAAQRLLTHRDLVTDIKSAAKFYDAGLYYIPIYELNAHRVGKFVTVDFVKQRDEASVKQYKANVLLRDVQQQAPAVKLGEWGIENIKIEKLRQLKPLKPFDSAKLEKDARIFEPNIPHQATELNKEINKSFVPGDETKYLEEKIRLIYCPVWLVKYTYRSRLYRIVLDAVTGQVLFARGPARDNERIPLMIGAMALFTWPIARTVRAVFDGSINNYGDAYVMLPIPFFILSSFMVFLMAMAWNQFRYSGELVWRGEAVIVEHVNTPPENFFEKIARRMVGVIFEVLDNVIPEKPNRWYGQW